MTPDKIGRYEIQSLLGKGGMGSVYKANDPIIRRTVALKIINLDQIESPKAQEEFKRRFFKEARICGKLTHPGILTIHDIGEEDGTPFIATEYIEGKTLSRFIEDSGNLDGKTLGKIFLQIGDALDYAHQNNVIHRDVKPQNIMIDGNHKITVLDFGLAKLAESEMTHLTRPGDFVGSPSYSSPEQVKGDTIDFRSDIFSFGVTAYEMITGYRPFTGGNINAVLFKIISGKPDHIILPNGFPPEVQPVLAELFEKALHKMPEYRFQSAGELAKVLHGILSEGDLSWTIQAETGPLPPELSHQETLYLGKDEEVEKTEPATKWYHRPRPKKPVGEDTKATVIVATQDSRPQISPALMGIAALLLILVAATIWWQLGGKKEPLPEAQQTINRPEEVVDSGPTDDPDAEQPDSESENNPQPEIEVAASDQPLESPEEPAPELPAEETRPEITKPVAVLSFADQTFERWLISRFDQNGDGFLDRTEAAAVVHIDTPGNSEIADLTGIGYFTGLKTLDCSSEKLSQIPPLPQSLEKLICSGNKLVSLPDLPAGLRILNASDNKLRVLDELPEALEELDIGNNRLEALPQLPDSLQSLLCSDNQLKKTPVLPERLQSANLSRNLFDAEDCSDLLAIKTPRLVYSPVADGDALDCDSLERQRVQSRNRMDKFRERFNQAKSNDDLKAMRTVFLEIEQSELMDQELLFDLQKRETEELLKSGHQGMILPTEIVNRFQKAAEEGLTEAEYALGYLYEMGISVKRNHYRANTWYGKAATEQYWPAVYGLGILHQAGEGVAPDDDKAAGFFLEAAQAGYLPAQYKLGEMYRTGIGMDKDHEKAFDWYKKAAENNHAASQHGLGYMYYEGLGVTGSKRQNRKEGLYWYCRAASQGYGQAKNRLRRLKKLENCTEIITERK